MQHRRFLLRPAMAAFSLVLAAAESGCAQDKPSGTPATAADSPRVALVIPAPAAFAPLNVPVGTQNAFMLTSARAGWAYVTREITKAGFVGATKEYPYLTIWDMASALAAARSARELGFINTTQYRSFVNRTLTSIEKLALYDKVAYNRMYDARNGRMVDAKAEPSRIGMGWSALDHGRFLIWMKIIADDPAFTKRAAAVVARLNMNRLVQNGYMQGEEIGSDSARTKRSYQEGRVGYEQYAAEGFALWGAKVDSALDFGINGKAVQLQGHTIISDTRYGDVMTSEPFVMMGLELGWKNEHWRNLSLNVLAAQEARFRETGIITMVSEDAIPVPPAYFYYYLLLHDGKPWVVTTVSGVASDTFPRWVSAKAAFGYHALAPTAYTWDALQAVKYGGTSAGWTAGVYEGTRKSTQTFNLNSAAIVMESAAYMKRGCPLIQAVCPKK